MSHKSEQYLTNPRPRLFYQPWGSNTLIPSSWQFSCPLASHPVTVLDREVAVLQVESHLVDANLAASESAKQACKDHLVATQVAEKIKPVGVEHFKPQVA